MFFFHHYPGLLFRLYRTELLFSLLLFLIACGAREKSSDERIEGKVFGAEFEVRRSIPISEQEKDSLISLFDRIQRASSRIGPKKGLLKRFNSSERGIALKGKTGKHLLNLVRTVDRVHRSSSGAFDPTVAPLIRFWGNDYQKTRERHEDLRKKLDSIQHFVGWEHVELVEKGGRIPFLKKSSPEIELDLSGLNKGYALQKASELLERKEQSFLFIRIGNKYLLLGQPSEKRNWKVPIGYPSKTLKERRISWLHLKRDTASVVTSGNFQKFYTMNGEKYSYTIDPQTGYPSRNRLLSVTVLTRNAAYADAMATSYMVMGKENAKSHAVQQTNLEAFFIASDEKGRIKTEQTSGVSFSRAEVVGISKVHKP